MLSSFIFFYLINGSSRVSVQIKLPQCFLIATQHFLVVCDVVK